jgi:hypothetical protein
MGYFVLQITDGIFSFKLFSTPGMNHFLEGNELNWENCVALCNDGAQAISRRNARLQALARKKTSRIFWAHCVLHRVALASRSMNEWMHTVRQAATRAVNYVSNSSLRGRLVEKLCDRMWAEHTEFRN